ncbi:MAG: transglycosylase family protein [Acidimicrobiia bacterium]|nr:transglycosylase family protein [Acidimicrobiia bacterium]
MGTNNTSLRPRRRGYLLALVVVVCLAATAPGATARELGSDEDPPYTNHRLAREELAWAEENLEAAKRRLADRAAEFDALVAEAADLVGQEQALISHVIESRNRAADYLVASYVTGRFGALSAELLALEHLIDALYLRTLLEAPAGAITGAYDDYERLLEAASNRLVFVVDRIDVVHRDIQLAQRDIPLLEERLVEARWVAFVADIHGEADREFARRGRSDPAPAQWAALRGCESTNNYLVNTGNGYYGAYQFDQATWESVGGTGRPHWAAPEVQDARARLLYARRGWQPWPICGRHLR